MLLKVKHMLETTAVSGYIKKYPIIHETIATQIEIQKKMYV